MARIRNAYVSAVTVGLLVSSSFGAVTYLGKVMVDGKGTDKSGLTNTLEDGSRNNGLDGFGSGMAYTGISPAPNVYRFISVADRGPNRADSGAAGAKIDNTTSYATRAQTWDITVTSATGGKYSVSVTHVNTTLFTNESGEQLVGRSDKFSGQDPAKNLRFDPESIRVAPDGTLYVSDEYGPSVYHFDKDGKRIGVLNVPAHYHVAKLSAKGSEEILGNSTGRVANKGFEGLAITPDGSRVIASIQAPLLQDGGDKSRYNRFVIFDAKTGDAVREVVYALDQQGEGNSTKDTISDIVAINDHEILVDERDGKKSNTKLAYVAELNGATDVLGRTSVLLKGELDSAITPMSKRLLFDVKATILASDPLTDVPAGYTAGIPDKIEGFAFGPLLPDGRRLFVVTNDNDFLLPGFVNGTLKSNAGGDGSGGYPNYFFIFAVDAQTLPGFEEERQQNSAAAAPVRP